MYNWSVNTNRLQNNSSAYIKWQLEQMINFGLDNQKLPQEKVKKYLSILNIDPQKKACLEFLLDD